MMIKNIVDDLPQHSFKKYGKRYLRSIKNIVLHHTGVDGKIENFANYHVSKGWPGIGYHFVIDKDAQIFMTNYMDTVSYHVSGHNTASIGIAVIGNYDIDIVEPNQKIAVFELVKTLTGLLGPVEVKGHNEFKATACPGKNITELIKSFNR